MKPEDVSFMFNEMVQRTEQLFFSPVEVDPGGGVGEHRFSSLPSFLSALAATVKQMRQVRVSYRGGGKGGYPPLTKIPPPPFKLVNCRHAWRVWCPATSQKVVSSFQWDSL